MKPGNLAAAIGLLRERYGKPPKPLARDPFGLAVLENCGYLVDDERRRDVFLALKKRTRLSPQTIRTMPTEQLAEILEPGGMLPRHRVEKLRRCAEIALDVGPARLKAIRKMPTAEARRILKRFPGIGDPGADKILLFCHAQRSLAPDSNALRVLVRLGFGRDDPNYAKTYRSAAEGVEGELPSDFASMVEAHQLLRHHGQELCKRTAPRCELCPLTKTCAWFQAGMDRPKPTRSPIARRQTPRQEP